ncbi:MAG: type II toxin-antitoxin system prevent-host-death family antitoxin [Planctomycetia bacterium]|nr:type II toxin-antitoxin system prevent-host-death family antitoxin [Planctomycetia bacterium]
MDAISHTAARANLAAIMTKVCRDRAPVIITRERGPSVVVLSLEEYNAIQETGYLLQSPANAKRLMQAKEALERRSGMVRSIDD